MPPSSPSHRHKRPCQATITNFFSPSPLTDSSRQDSFSAPDSQAQIPTPRGLAPLPAHIQSSLLNVGMRIRKAIPEGYKTHSPAPVQKPPLGSSSSVHAITPAQRVRPRELLPYCAINTVGNLNAENIEDEPGLHDADLPDLLFPGEDDDWDTPFSGQESRASAENGLGILVSSLPADVIGGRKRVWAEEEDHGSGDADHFEPSDFGGLLPSSDSATAPVREASMQLRPLAQPRSKRISVAATWQGAAGGKKVLEKPMGGSGPGDLEEADVFRMQEWLREEMEF